TIPDPDVQANAQFGASVGTTNTNIVIGAPGKDAGTGEVFEFQGDTTQPTFGDLLLDIPNPLPVAGSEFGLAVAGDGNDLIVGAPNAAATGKVYLFNGTTGAEKLSVTNPHPATAGVGSAGAAVWADIFLS